jgi:8-oxo-dGTP pyrophosphatase MutT (NUDIX family)
VLVVERGAGSRFLPGYVAFPGGSVDPADEGHAERWFGDAAEVHRAAAVRELIEEVGLALTSAGLVAAGADPFGQVEAAPPEADQIAEMAHWVAPPDVPVRFDARYFSIAAPPDLEPSPDGAETAHAWWVSPGELMSEWEEGRRKLYWPTFITVQHLAGCRSAPEILALRFETRDPTPEEEATLPRSVMEQD